jgi:hypothetical protein
MALIGYARVSTDDGRQTTLRQLDELRAAGCTEVLEEHANGTGDRPEPGGPYVGLRNESRAHRSAAAWSWPRLAGAQSAAPPGSRRSQAHLQPPPYVVAPTRYVMGVTTRKSRQCPVRANRSGKAVRFLVRQSSPPIDLSTFGLRSRAWRTPSCRPQHPGFPGLFRCRTLKPLSCPDPVRARALLPSAARAGLPPAAGGRLLVTRRPASRGAMFRAADVSWERLRIST